MIGRHEDGSRRGGLLRLTPQPSFGITKGEGSGSRRLALPLALMALLLAATASGGPVADTAAGTSAFSATPASGEGPSCSPADAPCSASDDQLDAAVVALAEKHAPVLLIPEAGTSCAEEGNPFFPVPVDVVLGNPEVALVADGDSPQIVRWAPAARDFFRRDRDHWLDLPGDPRNPGCAYQQDFAALLPQPAVGYARVAPDPSRPGLALQYWLFYYFNAANNTHEGDSELIQLSFAAGTAEEALLQEPQRISLAQHRSGETARWDEPKVRQEGDHPVVVAAAGSHAGYFRPGLYLRRSDLSCEDATGPFRRVAIAPVVVPPAVADPASPFAWLTYEGRWGQPAGGRWDGPTGPNTRSTWRAPLAWEAGLGRHSNTLGDVDPATSRPHRLLCAVAGLPAAAVNLDATHPLATRGLAALLVVLAGGVVIRRRRRSPAARAPAAGDEPPSMARS